MILEMNDDISSILTKGVTFVVRHTDRTNVQWIGRGPIPLPSLPDLPVDRESRERKIIRSLRIYGSE